MFGAFIFGQLQIGEVYTQFHIGLARRPRPGFFVAQMTNELLINRIGTSERLRQGTGGREALLTSRGTT